MAAGDAGSGLPSDLRLRRAAAIYSSISSSPILLIFSAPKYGSKRFLQ